MDTLKLGVCANVLNGLINVNISKVPKKPCCPIPSPWFSGAYASSNKRKKEEEGSGCCPPLPPPLTSHAPLQQEKKREEGRSPSLHFSPSDSSSAAIISLTSPDPIARRIPI